MTEAEMYTKMLYGENAIRAHGLLVMQDMGSHIAVCGTFPNIKTDKETHEIIECEIIIRPLRRKTTSEYKGMGLTGATQSLIQDFLI